MPSRSLNNTKKVQKELEKKISPILVINNSTLKPYVELFDYAPENIYQQPLGNLIGFFEVKEYSEDSAYIVNFLTSVLKKEYYINPKRSVGESLDSALHKVNLALSELVKHGNFQWLGKLHAAICVLEKNNAHFSVAGGAKIFLYRNNVLSEVSEGLATEDMEPNPLKTFANVSSGALEKNDRLLITSEDIFHILSYNDLKKNFQRFEGEKLVQLLKTALSNQMEMISTIVVGIEEPESKSKRKIVKKTINTENVFSQTTFAADTTIAAAATAAETIAEVALDATAVSEEAYRDEKTGHIYIQGEPEIEEITKTQLFLENFKENLGEFWYVSKNEIRRRHFLFKKNLAKKIENWKIQREMQAQLRAEQEKLAEEERIKQEELQRALIEQQEAEAAKIAEQQAAEAERLAEQSKIELAKLAEEQELATEDFSKPEIIKQTAEPIKTEERKLSFQEKLRLAMEENAPEQEEKTQQLSFQQKLQSAKQQRKAVIDLRPKVAAVDPIEVTKDIEIEEITEEEQPELPVKINLVEKESYISQLKNLAKDYSEKIFSQKAIIQEEEKQKAKHFAPRFSKIKKSFNGFTFNQKLYAIIGLILVFVVPIFIARWISRPKPHPITELQTTQPSIEKLTNEKNMAQANSQSLLSHSDLITTIVTSLGPLAITKNSIIAISNGQSKEYPIPANQGSITKATLMSDLSLVFVLTDQNKVLSFSPASLKFQENKINLSVSKDIQIGTYMTYLYVLDPEANQIYRYPRADGGFAEKLNWYKDTAPLAQTTDMTIDDSIYTIQNNQIAKFFKGKEQTFDLEATETPVKISKIFTSIDSNNLWILDTENARIISFDKTSGSIVSQYANENIKNATSLAVDEKNKTAYITTSSGLVSIALQ